MYTNLLFLLTNPKYFLPFFLTTVNQMVTEFGCLFLCVCLFNPDPVFVTQKAENCIFRKGKNMEMFKRCSGLFVMKGHIYWIFMEKKPVGSYQT